MSDPTPLTHIQLETGILVETLAVQHAEHIVLDYLDRRCLPRHIAREIIAGYHERQRVHAEHLQELRARTGAAHRAALEDTRARLAARAQRDAAMLAGDGSLPALAVMLAADTEAGLDRRGERDARLRRGESFGASFGKGV